MNSSQAPFVSIVLTGRHDNYGGDFNARFFRALRFNHDRLAERSVAHEVVFVEWNQVPGRPCLADLLAAEFPDLARSIFTSYVVDRRYHNALTLNPRIEYLEYVAKNVGIRRAAGRFILATNTDVLLGRHVIEVLAGGRLEARTVYRAPRIDIKLGADQTRIDWALLEDERNHFRRPTLQPPLYSGGTGDFVLLDRPSMHELRGFNEVYRLARVGVDYNFLVKAYACGLEIADIGGPVYHINHVGSFRISKALYRDRLGEAHFGDHRWHSRDVIYENPAGWGLSDAPVRPCGDRSFRLEFDWSAVPPLVHLRGVVLPAERVGRERP